MGTFCTDSCPLPLIKMTCLLGLSFSKSCSPQTRAFTWPFAWQSQLANWRCNEPGLLRGPIPLRIREVYSRVIAAPHLGHCCSKQGVPDWCVALTPQLGHTQSPPGPAAKRPPRPAPRFFPCPCLFQDLVLSDLYRLFSAYGSPPSFFRFSPIHIVGAYFHSIVKIHAVHIRGLVLSKTAYTDTLRTLLG